MTKVLNQLLYSSVVFGEELPSGVLRLESTSSGTKGAVEIVGTNFDLITGTQIGRLVHANTGLRLWDFPDYSGQVLISGIFTGANQLVYSSAAGVYAMLPNTVGGALVTDLSGAIQWAAGTVGQVLTQVAGAPVFADLPDVGFINPSPLGNQVAYYAVAGNDLSPLTTIASRTLLSTAAGALAWALIEAPYLKATGGVPLGIGAATQVLTAVGDGSFAWVNANPSLINPGTQWRLPYYSATSLGTVVSASTFIQTDETYRAFQLLNRGTIRFYEATGNGTDYLEFKAPLSFGPSVSWTLPSSDGVPTPPHPSLLQTDGAGNLSWITYDHGTVNAGLTNQVAYYAADGNYVSGLTTTAARLLGSTPLGALSWMLLTESYLSTTGGLPLGAGTLNQVLCSDSATNFKWMNAVDITGEVRAGVVNYLAFYPASGTKVDDTSFLSIDNSLKILNLEAGAQLRIYPPSGSFYVEFKAPTLAASSAWVLPAIDGLNGYALTTDGVGNLSFIEVGRGVVNTGTPMTLAYYQTADDEVFPWTNIASRVALTTALNEIAWSLITTKYLSTAGGVPLDVGIPNYMLSPDGFGNFVWVDVVSIVGKVNTAQAKQIAFYAYDGNQVYGSSWLRNYELAKTLEIGDGGSVQFFVAGDTASATLTSSPLMTTTVTWYLPIADATSIGQALVSDAAGQLSFTDLVDFGVQDAVATYQNGTARRVSPSANFFNPASGLLLTGSTFTITGDSVVPTIVTIKGGDSLLGAGANLYLAGGVGAVTSGSTVIGSGSNNYLSIDDGGWISVLDQASLRFYDSGSNYVGFKAPTTVPSSLIWTLPSADGLAGQFLWTDGVGNLSWVTNRINDGVLNAIPYYSAINELSPSTLLIPAGLPASLGHTLIVDHLTGQLSYKVIVEPLGTAGEIAVYTDTQKVGYYPNLLWDIVSNAIQVRYAGGLTLFEITDTYSTTLRSSPDLVVSTELVLPPDLPAENGYILTGETNGNLLFRAPNSDTRWEKRGIISLQSGMRSVTVLYDTPFDIIPAWINTQWVIGEDNSSYLPTYAVERSTTEGFIIRFSTQIPATGMYRINWQSYLTAVSSQTASIFISGGVDGSGYIDSLMGMLVDNDTMIVLAATLSSPRGFTCGGGSSVNGYIFGGSSPIPLPLGIITSFAYATSVLTDISATLITARSGAAGVGTRSKCYVAGGEVPGGGSFSSIETFDTTTEAVSSLGSSLASNSVSAGSATTKGVGAIAHSGLNSLERLTYATEVLSPSLATFGATDISVGANNATSNRGYFGRNAGYVYKYEFLVDTITVLSAGLNSVTGLSSASNSLDTAYFAGSSLMDALDFSTETVQTVATLPTLGHLAAASSTFQSKGLL